LLTGVFGPPDGVRYSHAKAWLETLDSARRDAKDSETLQIARLALRNSKWANIIAIIAMVLSVTIAIIQVFKMHFSLVRHCVSLV
jgi:hypothetical protein